MKELKNLSVAELFAKLSSFRKDFAILILKRSSSSAFRKDKLNFKKNISRVLTEINSRKSVKNN